MNQSSDVTLIGGGIIGMLTARELNKAGATVTLIEKNLIGRESSWAGGGILLPLYPWRQAEAVNCLVSASLMRYPALCDELIEATGIDPEWTPCGLLMAQIPDFDLAYNWLTDNGIALQTPPKTVCSGLEVDWLNPLWLPEIAHVRNPRLLKALKQDLLNSGVQLIENCAISTMHKRERRIESISTSLGSFAVNELVITTGAWTTTFMLEFLPEIDRNRPAIFPAKGQMLVFDAEPDTLGSIVMAESQYLIPRRDGKILAGSTVELTGFDKTPDPDTREQLFNFATGLLPGLQHYPVIHHWAGLRPGTKHGIPFIGRHPDFNNLSINSGHFRYGLVMGPASACLITDILMNRPPIVNPEPYQLSSEH